MKIRLASLALALLASPAMAQTGEGPKTLLGTWQADCDAWGTPAVCTLIWSDGLHAAQMGVDYTIAPAAGGDMIFAGEGVYRIGETALDGFWVDSGGAIHPLNAAWKNQSLTTHWGRAGSAQGRSRYALNPDGTLTVTDWSLTDKGWQQFMQVTYQRAD